jgi:hypothetical protein
LQSWEKNSVRDVYCPILGASVARTVVVVVVAVVVVVVAWFTAK